MTYQLTINRESDYLHAIVTGQNSQQNVALYLDEIMQERKATDCYRILIEERLEGPRLEALDIFDVVSEGSSRVMGLLSAVAFVDVNAEGDLMQFAETVAVNRALPVRYFSTVTKARKWLVDQAR